MGASAPVAVAGDSTAPFAVRLKICDLGLSVGGERRKSASGEPCADGELFGESVGGGSQGYAPPEVREVTKQGPNWITERSDSWGLMACLLHAINGCLPEGLYETPPRGQREHFRTQFSSGQLEVRAGID